MQDGFSILSPAGYIMDVSVVLPQNGPGTYGGVIVSQALPCGSVQIRGKGEHSLYGPQGYPLSGRQGTMWINCITGAAGANQAVVFLAMSPTRMLGVALDTNNRPYALITDIYGFQVGKSGVFGPSIPANTPLMIQFAWDSEHTVYAGDSAGFQFNNQVAVWWPDVITWTPFVPSVVYVGTSLGGLALSDFTGVVDKVQIGDQVIFDLIPGALIEAEEYLSANANMLGNSSATAGMDLVLGGFSDMDGDSSIGADATMAYDASSTMDGDSSAGLGAIVAYDAGSSMDGDSSAGLGATVAYDAGSSMDGDSSIGLGATVDYDASSTMDGDSSVGAGATASYDSSDTMSGDSSVTATATVVP